MTRRMIKRVILLKFILITFQLHAVDDKEDFVYDLSLATQGISVSQFNTGVNYSLGRGIEKHLERLNGKIAEHEKKLTTLWSYGAAFVFIASICINLIMRSF